MGKRGAGFASYRAIGNRYFGLEYSRVGVGETPYLDRYIAYAFGFSLRLHKFWRGDDDRAPHDHPWDFWTFPLATYCEKTPYGSNHKCDVWAYEWKPVKAFRWHRRDAKYRHIVTGRADGSKKPFWTIVVTGRIRNTWGFWPTPIDFVPWRKWLMNTYSVMRTATITWTEEYRAASFEEVLKAAREEDEKNFARRFQEDKISLDDWSKAGVFES